MYSSKILQQAKQKMEKEWDLRSRKNSLHYIAVSKEEWDSSSFFKVGEDLGRSFLEDIGNYFSVSNKGKALDIGCGAGRFSRFFATQFEEVYGVDVSGEMIHRAKIMNSDMPNLFFSKNDGATLKEFGDDFFDFIFSYVTLQHVPEREIIFSYLKEVARTLAPQGVFQIHLFVIEEPRKRGLLRKIISLIPKPVKKFLLFFRSKDWHKVSNTWRGRALTPDDVKNIMVMLGELGIECASYKDATHPPGTRIWLVGKKNHVKT